MFLSKRQTMEVLITWWQGPTVFAKMFLFLFSYCKPYDDSWLSEQCTCILIKTVSNKQVIYSKELCYAMLCCAKSLQSCLTLHDPVDTKLLGSSLHGILQATILGWVSLPSFRGSSQIRDQTHSSWIAGRFLITEPLGKPYSKYSYLQNKQDFKTLNI